MNDTDLETAIAVIEFYEAVMLEQVAKIATLEAANAELEREVAALKTIH